MGGREGFPIRPAVMGRGLASSTQRLMRREESQMNCFVEEGSVKIRPHLDYQDRGKRVAPSFIAGKRGSFSPEKKGGGTNPLWERKKRDRETYGKEGGKGHSHLVKGGGRHLTLEGVKKTRS